MGFRIGTSTVRLVSCLFPAHKTHCGQHKLFKERKIILVYCIRITTACVTLRTKKQYYDHA